MINISSIKTNMYCPMKLYIETHIDPDENNNHQKALEIKKLKIDIHDLMQKNMRKLRREMSVRDIENTLSENIIQYIENSTIPEITEDEIDDVISNACFDIKLKALKAKQAMKSLDKDGFTIVEMFFPSCMYSYLLKDTRLEIIGMCDKIEIIDGKYYPVSVKNTKPPLKGVWDSDAVELVPDAILIEEEFDTEVFVGFVYYTKIDEKRPVIMDVNLRKALFEVLNEVREIVENKKYPKVKVNDRKCESCQYREICFKE